MSSPKEVIAAGVPLKVTSSSAGSVPKPPPFSVTVVPAIPFVGTIWEITGRERSQSVGTKVVRPLGAVASSLARAWVARSRCSTRKGTTWPAVSAIGELATGQLPLSPVAL